jgi:hypothetical protein
MIDTATDTLFFPGVAERYRTAIVAMLRVLVAMLVAVRAHNRVIADQVLLISLLSFCLSC